MFTNNDITLLGYIFIVIFFSENSVHFLFFFDIFKTHPASTDEVGVILKHFDLFKHINLINQLYVVA